MLFYERGLSGKHESLNASEIGEHLDSGPAQSVQFVCDEMGLIPAKFKCDPAFGLEERGAILQEAVDDIEPVFAAVESHQRIAPDLAAEAGYFCAGDVGEVGDDEVKATGDFFEQIAPDQRDAMQLKAGGVQAGEIEGFFGEIDQQYFCAWPAVSEAESDAAAAAGHVEDAAGGAVGKAAHEDLAEVFRLWPGNERALIADQFQVAKFHGAQQVLQGCAAGALFGQGAQFFEIWLPQ